MLRCPTSELPIWPGGSPTAGPDASRAPCGYAASSPSKTGVEARLTALPGPAGAQPQPSRTMSTTGRVQRPVVLMVLDGWGCAPAGPGNAVSLASTPVFDGLLAAYPHGALEASGPAVGLPPGQMGNSEVGHLNIGAGRVVYQDLTRISKAIADGDFFANRVLKQACAKAAGRGSRLHLIGLVSGGGVHSDMGHLKACLEPVSYTPLKLQTNRHDLVCRLLLEKK